jgi:hypothetical protein
VNAEPSFFSRVVLAYVVFFRVLFQAAFAKRVQRLDAGDVAVDRSALVASAQPAVEVPEPAVAPTGVPALLVPEQDVAAALSLLALLQLEARLIDFTEQDIDGFSDADVGSAARLVHA